MFKRFINDIYWKRICLGMLLLALKLFSSNEYHDYAILTLLCIDSLSYLISHFKDSNVDRQRDYVKVVLIFREVATIFALLFIEIGVSVLLKVFWPNQSKMIEILSMLYRYVIVYRFLLSFMSIIIGIRIFKMLLIVFAIVPLVIFIGAFDVRWWAAVTGVVGIWNYINSKDFILYLRKGKSAEKIPEKLEYQWQKNKFFVNLGTIIFYISLAISSIFEKNNMSIVDRANPRVYSLLGLLVFLALSYLFLFIYFIVEYKGVSGSKFEKSVLWLGKKFKLNKLRNIIDLYKISISQK
ncbi:TPA: hypothetical protein ACGOWZ_000994 [Streptococcus suis]